MNQHVLHHLSLIAESHGVYAEDFSDQLMSKYTSVGLVAVASIMAMRQYVFKPIQCWVPAEWPRPWEEYTENYCWIQNTYHVAWRESGHPGLQSRQESEISYFQWVPILLFIQAFLVYAPHIFWRAASAHSGCDAHRVVKLAMELEAAHSAKKRRKLTVYVASQLGKALTVAGVEAAENSGRESSGCRRRCQFALFATYLVSKLVYLLSGLGHLLLMKFYLGFRELHFGLTCALDIANGRLWQQTRVFPRVTFCDLPVKQLGQWNTRSVQCVLPMNMLNEKIYIFLWFWFVLCMALTLCFTLYWIFSLALPSARRRFLGCLQRLARPHAGIGGTPKANGGPAGFDHHKDLHDSQRSGVTPHYGLDAIFVLQMVAIKCSDLCASQILDAMMMQEPPPAVVQGSSLQPIPDGNTLPLASRSRPPYLNPDDILSQGGHANKNGHIFGPTSDV